MGNEQLNISEDQLKMIVKDVVRGILEHPEYQCRFQIETKQHNLDHEAIERFVKFTEKIDNIKWETAKVLVISIVLAAFGFMVFGAAIKIKLLALFGV